MTVVPYKQFAHVFPVYVGLGQARPNYVLYVSMHMTPNVHTCPNVHVISHANGAQMVSTAHALQDKAHEDEMAVDPKKGDRV